MRVNKMKIKYVIKQNKIKYAKKKSLENILTEIKYVRTSKCK